VEPIILYGTPAYPLTLHREQRICGAVTRMLRYIRGASPSQHLSLKEIYSTAGENQLDIPQITTSIVVRQLTLLRNLATHIPSHPLITILLTIPQGKKKASRQLLLRDMIRERVGGHLDLQTLQSLTNDDIAQRAQQYEQRVYDRAAAAHARRRVLDALDRALARLPRPEDDDIPLSELPIAQVLRQRPLEKRLRTVESLAPNALLLPDELTPVSAQTLINSYTLPARVNAAPVILPQPATQHFWIAGTGSGAGIFHGVYSTLNSCIPIHNAPKFTAEATAIRSLLCEFPRAPLTISVSHPQLLSKIKALPRVYYQRMLRKHILWKDIFLLLRSRNSPVEFLPAVHDASQSVAARMLATAAAALQSPLHISHEIAALPWE
jgi:hypothetical protein